MVRASRRSCLVTRRYAMNMQAKHKFRAQNYRVYLQHRIDVVALLDLLPGQAVYYTLPTWLWGSALP